MTLPAGGRAVADTRESGPVIRAGTRPSENRQRQVPAARLERDDPNCAGPLPRRPRV